MPLTCEHTHTHTHTKPHQHAAAWSVSTQHRMAARINAEHHRAPRTHNHCKVQNHSVCNKVCLFAVCAVVVARQTDRQTGRQVRLLLLVCACAVVRQLRAWLVVGCTHSRCLHVHMEWLVVCLCVDLAQGRAGTTTITAAAARRGKPSQPHGCTNAQTRPPEPRPSSVCALQCSALTRQLVTGVFTAHKQASTHTPQCCTSVQLCPSHTHTHHNVPSIHVTHSHNTHSRVTCHSHNTTHNTHSHHTSCMHNHSQLSQISQLCSPLRCVLTSHDVTVTQARACDDVTTVVGCGMAVHVNKQQQKQQKEGYSVTGCAVHKNQGTTNKPTASLLTRNKVCAW